MKFLFSTLGCKVNQYETSVMEQTVTEAGHTVVRDGDTPDVAVLNSCTVTAESDRKTRQMLHRIRRAFPSAVLVLTGCLPQAFPDEMAASADADVVLGNATNAHLLDAVASFLADGKRVVDVKKHLKDEEFTTPCLSHFSERTRAYVKIQDGCERYCTYCIIPKSRGFVRSKTPDLIEQEVAQLVKNGHKEIVLVGINLSTYGKDLGLDLADAVDAVCRVDGVRRVRLGSLEPDLFTDAMLDRFAKQPAFCPQFHLALQSGCDATLKRMNRHYDGAFYADLVARVRHAFPNAAITTDVMVGFPGEDEDEFAQSLAFVKAIGFSRCHVFAYSRRAGTFADTMPNQVPAAVKQARSRAMIAAAKESEAAYLQSLVGEEADVLVEQVKDGVNQGYTVHYVAVRAEGPDRRGDLVRVRLTQVEDSEHMKGVFTDE